MWLNCLKQITKFALIVILLTPTLLPADAIAQIYEGVREMRWSSSLKRCVGGGYNEITKKNTADVLNFNPFGSNKDVNWELTNGICAAYIAAAITTVMTTKYISGYLCNNVTAGAIYSASVAAGVPLSPKMIADQAAETGYCSAQSGLCAIPASAPVSCPLAATCCGGVAATGLAIAGAIAGLAIIYGVANGAYQKARICGYEGSSPWKTWQKEDGSTWKKGAYPGSYKKSVQDYASSIDAPSLKNEKYREFIFGGIEYEDKGDGSCDMPKWSKATKENVLGYSDKDKLVYYMTGSNEAPVFACYRFLLAKGTDKEIAAGQKAYDCCSKRSQNTVCIENAPNVVGPEGSRYEYVFCEVGQRCNVRGVWFDAYISHSKANYACAKTYSGCPYNHPLGGGTEVADYGDSEDLATMQNYCQYMSHCSILPIKPYVSQSSLTGAFFDSSCRDMKGDSQNTYGYSSNLTPVDVRGFSAPMAQCFKETIQNIFFNKAGSTLCADSTETPNSITGFCKSGFKYKKGDDLRSYQRSMGQSGNSFFVRVQSALQNTIKMALSIAIMFLGVSILIGGGGISNKQIIPFVVKIAFVMYFATGNEWQSWVINGILGSSAELSDIMFRTDSLTGTTTTTSTDLSTGLSTTNYVTDASVPQNKLDGCQFPRYNYADINEDTRYRQPAYQSGKEYLRIWDTLDCKIGRALGYGIDVSVPNLVMMILGGFLTGGAGIIFLLATFVFAFCLIALTIRALHIFILSTTAIIILFYMSPIMVTMVMFTKTKGMFDKWWKNILSFALQPMILFAYLGILLSFFDSVVMGDVTFIGDGKSVPKQVVCGDAANTSIYCIFNPPISGSSGAVATYDKLKMLGIGLPVLTSMNQTKITSLIKAAVLFFILMSFLDKITDFAKTLTGGDAELKSNTMSAGAMMNKAQQGMSAIQKRGMGAVKKHGTALAGAARSGIKAGASKMGDRGKKAEDAPAPRSEGTPAMGNRGGDSDGSAGSKE